MRLLLIRHGETAHNAQRLALGREDLPLNDLGQLQARALAAACGRSAGDAIAAIYSSPLCRAADTARPLANAAGVAVQDEPRLIEMDVGEVEGQDFDEVRRRYPEFLREWASDRCGDVAMPGGGETLRDVQERAWQAIESMLERHADETVAAVTHNFVILTLLCRVLGLPLGRFRRVRHDLAAVSVIELTPQRKLLVALNDRSHLEGEGLPSGPSWGRR